MSSPYPVVTANLSAPYVTTVQSVRQAVFNDFGSPIAITASTWGPADGHYKFIPLRAGTSAAITIHSVFCLFDAHVAPTTALLRIQLDPTGRAAMCTNIDGEISVSDIGTDQYSATWKPEVTIASTQDLAGLLTFILSAVGQFYLDFNFNQDSDLKVVVVTYSINMVKE